jgi:hypothetical protein
MNRNDFESIIEKYAHLDIEYSKRRKKWYGLVIDNCIAGTHKKYNVVYNGSCVSEYFDEKKDAVDKMWSEWLKYRTTVNQYKLPQ